MLGVFFFLFVFFIVTGASGICERTESKSEVTEFDVSCFCVNVGSVYLR